MIQIIYRNIKRFVVFIPGIVIAYVSLKYTLPFFDKRLPDDALAILATYVLGAYVLVPAVIRFWRIFFPSEHLPLYCVTPDGFASDPLNIGLVGTRRELIMAMEKAGWYRADPHSPANIIRAVLSVIFGWEYSHAPVSSLYLFGRKQDLAFEIPINGTYVRRHHVRFWATTFDEEKPFSARSIHWHHRREHLQGDTLLWVGAASLDIGIMPIRHNLQITHMVHPDTNRERDLIYTGLKSKRLVGKKTQLKLGNPYKLVNRTWRGELQTDGFMTVAWLKK
jgi:LssY C-terminus